MDDSTSNQDRHEELRSAIDEWKERIHEKNPSLKIPSDEDIIEYLSAENPESRNFWENQTLQAWKVPLDKVVKAASLGIWNSIKNSLNSAYLDPDER
ncbi:MAG: hypothetical protein E6534_03210, partial [Corynebacterium kroppenstedtii]|nr:hypothetical protein [Corynebacterium kroppenstedtii]